MNNNPNKDVTYCKSEVCKKKCWRHISKWNFNENESYWLMEGCYIVVEDELEE